MKKIIPLIVLILAIACNKNKTATTKQTPIERRERVLAIYTRPDSIKVLDVMLRVITKQIRYDSSARKDNIVIDTIWGRPIFLPKVDSTGKEIKGPDGKPVLNSDPNFIEIRKDSVNWHIQGISLDTLLKKE